MCMIQNSTTQIYWMTCLQCNVKMYLKQERKKSFVCTLVVSLEKGFIVVWFISELKTIQKCCYVYSKVCYNLS